MGLGPPFSYRGLSLHYYSNRSLKIAMWEEWAQDEEAGFVGFGVHAAREFKFDTGRARYLWQDYNTNGSPSVENWDTDELTPMHTDYAGETPYLDGSLSDPGGTGSFIVTGQSRYFGGSGQQTLDPQGTGNVLSRRYFHGDLIDSNVMTTDQAGAAVATTAYTAFGEAISWHAGAASPGLPDDPEALGTRYQYAGAWGYESPTAIDYTGGGGGGGGGSGSGVAPYSEGPGLTLRGVNPLLPPITLSHVGARWYQPGVGRFVQRDPIGAFGSLNVYSYVYSLPVIMVDPSGLDGVVARCPRCRDCLCGGPGFCRDMVDRPRPRIVAGIDTIQSETQARDLANTVSWVMGGIAAFGGPPGWAAGALCISLPYIYDFIERSRTELYLP